MGGLPHSAVKIGYCRPERSQESMIMASSDSRLSRKTGLSAIDCSVGFSLMISTSCASMQGRCLQFVYDSVSISGVLLPAIEVSSASMSLGSDLTSSSS